MRLCDTCGELYTESKTFYGNLFHSCRGYTKAHKTAFINEYKKLCEKYDLMIGYPYDAFGFYVSSTNGIGHTSLKDQIEHSFLYSFINAVLWALV